MKDYLQCICRTNIHNMYYIYITFWNEPVNISITIKNDDILIFLREEYLVQYYWLEI